MHSQGFSTPGGSCSTICPVHFNVFPALTHPLHNQKGLVISSLVQSGVLGGGKTHLEVKTYSKSRVENLYHVAHHWWAQSLMRLISKSIVYVFKQGNTSQLFLILFALPLRATCTNRNRETEARHDVFIYQLINAYQMMTTCVKCTQDKQSGNH